MVDTQELTATVYIDDNGRARINVNSYVRDKMKLKNKQKLKTEILDGKIVFSPIKEKRKRKDK